MYGFVSLIFAVISIFCLFAIVGSAKDVMNGDFVHSGISKKDYVKLICLTIFFIFISVICGIKEEEKSAEKRRLAETKWKEELTEAGVREISCPRDVSVRIALAQLKQTGTSPCAVIKIEK